MNSTTKNTTLIQQLKEKNIRDQLTQFCGALSMLNTYTKDTGNVEIKYGKAEDFTEIAEKYHLKDNIDNASTFAKCVSLMNYQTTHMLHNGGYDNHITDIPGILEYAWDNNIEKSVIALCLCRLEPAGNVKRNKFSWNWYTIG